MSLRQVTDEAVTKFQNPWCLYECESRNDQTCEWSETGNCPYVSGKTTWKRIVGKLTNKRRWKRYYFSIEWDARITPPNIWFPKTFTGGGWTEQ